MRTFFLCTSALALAANEEKNRPVTKVINLLKNMLDTFDKEAKADKEVYDKFACWCKTNEREKTTSIKEAGETIDQLTANIEEYAATTARLESEIANLEEEVDKNQKALDKATNIRREQLAEMNAEEKDLIKSIRALKSAITALKKHNSMLELPQTTLEEVATLLNHQAIKEVIPAAKRKQAVSFLQAPGGFQSKSSQSGQIFGILGSMKDTFEANLKTSQENELENARLFEALKKSKEEEIAAGQSQINKKTEQRANTKEAHAEAKQNLEDTIASKTADETFLADLQTRCAATDDQWEERQASRQGEIAAVNKAIEILGSDDSHDSFTTTFNFAQVTQSTRARRNRANAAQLIQNVASKFDNPKLSHLASAMRLDAFTKVKKAIQDMIAALTKEKTDEIKHKDWCNEALHQNTSSQEATQRDIDEEQASVDGLDSDIKTLTEEIDTLKAEVKELHVQVKRAGETRAIENKEFQEITANQKETLNILQKAITVLRNEYDEKTAEQKRGRETSFAQEEPAGPPPPAGFKEYKKSSGADNVIATIEQIASEAKQVQTEAINDEESSQQGYESFVKESNRSINEKNKGIVNKTAVKAEKDSERTATQTDLDADEKKSQSLSKESADVHKSCDFVLKNFDIRQDARDEEVEALRQASAILSGSSASFLQK